MTDDDPIEMPVTKHGIKVTYVPPHLRPTPYKSSTPVDSKEQKCRPAKSAVKE
jgi:hypothetical protein